MIVDRPVDPVPPSHRRRNAEFYAGSAAGTKVLIVDDDFRNIFALTALLERGHLEVARGRERPRGPGSCSTSGQTSRSC